MPDPPFCIFAVPYRYILRRHQPGSKTCQVSEYQVHWTDFPKHLPCLMFGVRQEGMRLMSDKTKNDFWFPAKKYGVGWGFPITWQGWAVFLGYIVVLISGSFFLTRSPFGFIFFPIFVVLLTALLIFICWKKGEKPDLRWGNKN